MNVRDEIAAALNGSEYPLRLTTELKAQAKAAGVVIIYGASDDLMEFDGAISDEIGANCGVVALIDAAGVLSRDAIDDDDDEAIAAYVVRKKSAMQIEALWCKEGDYSWTYCTQIPHATFEIVEDGEPYCRGLVISITDLQTANQA
jgi:hypothetical protein